MAKKKTEPSKVQNFRVLASAVGPYPKGRIVSGEELKRQNADMAHLINHGAIEATEDSPSTGALPTGPENNLQVGPKSIETGTKQVDGYDDMTKDQLQTEAEAVGLEDFKSMKKDELIVALREKKGTAAPEPEGNGEPDLLDEPDDDEDDDE